MTSEKTVSKLFGFFIFILPIPFAFFTLKKGYSTRARALSFVWLIIFIIIGISADNDNKSSGTASQTSSPSSESSTTKLVEDKIPEKDLQVFPLTNESGEPFKEFIEKTFNYDDLKKLPSAHFTPKTQYESLDEYKARLSKSVNSFNKAVKEHVDKNVKDKYVTAKIEQFSVSYNAEKEQASFSKGMVNNHQSFPSSAYLYAKPLFYRYNYLGFSDLLSDGIKLDKKDAIAADVVNNPGYLLATFRLTAKSGDIDNKDKKNKLEKLEAKYAEYKLPTLELVKCDWIVKDKKLWSWKGEGEYSGPAGFVNLIDAVR
jgi:hypothetical protein